MALLLDSTANHLILTCRGRDESAQLPDVNMEDQEYKPAEYAR
jgi:hypothetical protein